MKYLFIVLVLCQSSIFGQEFLISNIYADHLTTNQHTSEIYFKDYFSLNDYYVADLKTMTVKLSGFNCLPVFSYNTNKMIFRKNDTLHLFDLERNSHKIFATSDSLNYSEYGNIFSPNGDNVILDKYIYLFKDTSLKPIKLDFISNAIWSSDTTLIALGYSGSKSITEYSINSSRKDTIYKFTLDDDITPNNWDYDIKRHKLYFPKYQDSQVFGQITQLHAYDRFTRKDTIIFEAPKDIGPGCSSIPFARTNAIKWSYNYDKMVFMLNLLLDMNSTNIYIYCPDSNSITKITDGCFHSGVKLSIYWANNDTLVYNDITYQQLYGIGVPNFTSIINETDPTVPHDYSLSNYPNPFNGSTVIEYNMPLYEIGEIQIFNILGQKINSFGTDRLKPGKNKISWNGKDIYGKNVSSGIYFAVLQLNKNSMPVKPLKIVYLK